MLKQLLQDWGKASSEDGSRTFLTRLKGVHWNTPEGCVSIVSENLNGGSLLNMLQSTGAIPELILKQIARKVLESIDFMHNKSGVSHNGLTLSQILLNKRGDIKLNLGLKQIFKDNQGSEMMGEKMSLYEALEFNSSTRFEKFLGRESSIEELK